jgi:hypothetical protein
MTPTGKKQTMITMRVDVDLENRSDCPWAKQYPCPSHVDDSRLGTAAGVISFSHSHCCLAFLFPRVVVAFFCSSAFPRRSFSGKKRSRGGGEPTDEVFDIGSAKPTPPLDSKLSETM